MYCYEPHQFHRDVDLALVRGEKLRVDEAHTVGDTFHLRLEVDGRDLRTTQPLCQRHPRFRWARCVVVNMCERYIGTDYSYCHPGVFFIFKRSRNLYMCAIGGRKGERGGRSTCGLECEADLCGCDTIDGVAGQGEPFRPLRPEVVEPHLVWQAAEVAGGRECKNGILGAANRKQSLINVPEIPREMKLWRGRLGHLPDDEIAEASDISLQDSLFSIQNSSLLIHNPSF